MTRRAKERIGQLLVSHGKEHEQVSELGAGDIGAVAKLKETRAGDVLAGKDTRISFPPLDLPAPVMAFAFEPKTKGDEEKAASAIRRLEEEDPTLDVHRDQQTGEQIIAGLTQIHVEVIVDRMKERFGAEIKLHPPRVPYLEAIRKPAKAHGRYKKQTGGRGQFGDCHIEIEPGRAGHRLRVRRRDQGRRHPQGLHPRGREGDRRGDAARRPRRLPGQGPAGRASTTASTTASTPRRTHSRSPARWPSSRRWRRPTRCCSSRSCCSRSASPRTWSATWSAISTRAADGRSAWRRRARRRRSRPRCRWPRCSTTRRDLRAITGGRGDYTMEFARHEEIPSHLAQKVISEARAEEEVRA